MPVAYSQDELRPLLDLAEESVRALDAVEADLLERHGGEPGHALFTDLPLDGKMDSFKIYGVSAPGAATLRLWPGEANQAPTDDAWSMLVMNPETGGLKAILAGDDLNTLRTAVPAGLGARHLAPEGAKVACILGSSVQARGCARSIASALPQLGELVVWSPTPENRERFAEEQTERLGVPVRAIDTAEEAVGLGDVVVAAGRTAGGEAAYEGDWVKPGALAISMTRSAPPDLIARSQYVFPTENRPAVVAIGFAGIVRPTPQGDAPDVISMADVITGKVKARKSDDQIVVFELANLYTWDHAITNWAYAWAQKNANGTSFNLSSGDNQ